MSDNIHQKFGDPGMPRGSEITVTEYLALNHRTPLVNMVAREWATLDEVGKILEEVTNRMNFHLIAVIRTELVELLNYLLKECEEGFLNTLYMDFLPYIYANGYLTTEELETMGFYTGRIPDFTLLTLDEDVSQEA